MKTKHRFLSFFLALVILILSLPSFPIVSNAEEKEASAESEGDALTYTELTELRDTFSKYFRRSDGKNVAVIYAEPIHSGESGNMIDIDNRLTYQADTGRYQSANEAFAVSFAGSPAADNAVSISFDGYTLSWHVDTVRNTQSSGWETFRNRTVITSIEVVPERASSLAVASVTKTDFVDANRVSVFTQDQLSSAFTSVSGIRYDSAFTDSGHVDLSYTLAPNRLEEDIILNGRNDIRSYVLTMSADGLTAVKQNDNSILFVDAGGKEVFTISAPWMQDALYAYSESITVSVIQKDGTVTVVYTPDADWLNAAERVYPVLIDPSVKSRDYTSNYEDGMITPTMSSIATTQTSTRVGASVGYETYTKILSYPYIYESMSIDSVTMSYFGSRSSPTHKLNLINTALDFSTMTGANRPLGSGGHSPTITQIGSYFKHSYNITSVAKDYVDTYGYSGLNQITGYRLYNADSTVTTGTIYISSENTAEYRPVLEITYSKSYDLPFVGGGVYTLINKNSNKALTVAPNYSNAYQFAKMSADRQAFTLIGDKRIFTVEPIAKSGEALTWEYSGSSATQGATNLYSSAKTTANADQQEFIFQYVTEDATGYEYYAILSRADTRYAWTAYGTSNGSTSGTAVTSSGNIYMSLYTGSATQLWRLESGGMPIYNGQNIIPCNGRTFTYDYGVEASVFQPYCYVTTYGERITWASSDTSVVSFHEDYHYIILNGMGTATLTASIMDSFGTVIRSYSYTVTVAIDNGVYYIKNTKTNTYLSVPGVDVDGVEATVMQSKETAGGGMYQQLWKLYHIGNGRYSIRSMVNLDTALDVTGSVVDIYSIGLTDTRSGVPDYAEWDFVINSTGTYRIRHKGLNTATLYATASGIGTNTAATTVSAVQSAGQEWILEQVSVPTFSVHILNAPTYLAPKESVDVNATYYSPALASQAVTWVSSNTDVATVDASGVVTGVAAGSAVITATGQVNANAVASFTVNVTSVAEGQYFFRSPQNGEIITESGTGYETADFDNGDDQLFVLDRVDGEYYSIQSVNSGKYLTVSGSSTAIDADIIQQALASSGFTAGQLWMIEPTANGRYKIYTKAVNEASATTLNVLATGLLGGVDQDEWVSDNNSYYDEWKLHELKIINLSSRYDDSFEDKFGDRSTSIIGGIESFVVTALNSTLPIRFNATANIEHVPSLADTAGHEGLCDSGNLECGDCTDHHKNVFRASSEIYNQRIENTLYITWAYRTDLCYNSGTTHTSVAAAMVFADHPVVGIFYGLSYPDYSTEMKLILLHEIGHIFGIEEVYNTDSAHQSGSFDCVMMKYPLGNTDAENFYEDISGGKVAYCDDCINTMWQVSLIRDFSAAS